MIHGVDTGFLVAAELEEHSENANARIALSRLSKAGDRFGIAPQVLAEFLHIATDARRFSKPLTVAKARDLAEQWWTAEDVVAIFPDNHATSVFLAWVKQHSLGRKRLLDTLLAATYQRAGVLSLLTTNPNDFNVFGVFTCITPKSGVT